MRINRRFLYAGTFLVALGGVLVATDLAAVDTTILTDVLRLWPLAIIAIGLGVVLRRNPQLSLTSGVLAAAVPGLVLGGAFAVAPGFSGDCGNKGEQAITQRQEGSFAGPATIALDGGCGSITINTAAGKAWKLEAGNAVGQEATVLASSTSLSIESPGGSDSRFFSGRRSFWNVTLPTSPIDELAVVVNAGTGQIDLPGARIGRLDFEANLAQVNLDLSEASVEHLSGAVNLGQLTVKVPARSDLTGSLHVDGGMLEICSAPGAGLRVVTTGSPRELHVNGVEQTSSNWQNPDFETAAHRAEIVVEVNFGAVEINPIGGCR